MKFAGAVCAYVGGTAIVALFFSAIRACPMMGPCSSLLPALIDVAPVTLSLALAIALIHAGLWLMERSGGPP